MNPIGDIFCIQNLEYFNLVNQMNLIDNIIIREQEAQLKFVSTNANIDMKGPRNPERGLVRFQLYEALIRIAEEKFIKSGVC